MSGYIINEQVHEATLKMHAAVAAQRGEDGIVGSLHLMIGKKDGGLSFSLVNLIHPEMLKHPPSVAILQREFSAGLCNLVLAVNGIDPATGKPLTD